MPQSIPQTFSKRPPQPGHLRVHSSRYPDWADAVQTSCNKVINASARYGFAVGQLNKAREWRSGHTAGNREWPRERVQVKAYIERMRLLCHRLKAALYEARAEQADLMHEMLR